jgi:hypothetical protein
MLLSLAACEPDDDFARLLQVELYSVQIALVTKTLAAFGSRLREATDLDIPSNDVVGVARSTVQPATTLCGYAPIRSLRQGVPPSDSPGTTRRGCRPFP